MVTKEQLLERRAQLESDLEAQHHAAAAAQAQVQDGQRKLGVCRDMINALSGAKQDVDHWLKQLEPATPAAEPIETIVGKDDAPIAAPATEKPN